MFRMQSLDDIDLIASSSSQACEEWEESSNSDIYIHTPEVRNELKPKINQHFKDLDEVFKFYNDYAFVAGFGVRIN